MASAAAVLNNEHDRNEQLLAVARLALSLIALLALWVEKPDTDYAEHVVAMISLFAAYAGALFLVSRVAPHRLRRHGRALHVLDIGWAVVITLLTEGPGSPFFPLFIFVLVSASYRWGLRESVLTGAVSALLLVFEAGLHATGVMVSEGVELDRLIMRCGYLAGLGAVLGGLADEQRRLRREAAIAADLFASVRLEAGFRASLKAILERILDVYGGRRALAMFQERASHRVYVWELHRNGDRARVTFAERPSGTLEELPAAGREVAVIRADGERRGTAWLGQGWQTIVISRFDVGTEWRGRLILLDPSLTDQRSVRLLCRLLQELAPSLYSSYLLGKLRSRVGAVERARVARELHDGLVQGLFGLEMEVAVLARKAEIDDTPLATELTRLLDLVREQALQTRDLMRQMRPVDLTTRPLTEHLTDIVDRFHRDTGINAQFVTDMEDVDVPTKVARELVRIVQEALINVRKHSGASNVIVRFGTSDHYWLLVIDDDGQGFAFDEQQVSLDTLEAKRRGPLVIKERVRLLKGDLKLSSTPGQGARLEIAIPQEHHD